MNKWTWKNSPELMARLMKAQSQIKAPVDITTFAGYCGSEEELRAHVEYYERQVKAA